MKTDTSRARRELIRFGLALCAVPALAGAAWGQSEPMPRPRRPPRPTPYGFRVEEVDAIEARSLGVGAGLRVVYSIALAYESGLRLDDVIVALNGRAVTTDDAFWAAVDAAQGRMALEVLRGAERLIVRIEP